uniref:Uncharacterized protein n=1 Tax=Aegilops tauschii subsp. strangulata TaxID=200361 RepID=A0A453CFZ9_AEGTS
SGVPTPQCPDVCSVDGFYMSLVCSSSSAM